MTPPRSSHAQQKPSDARITELEADVAQLAAAIRALAEASGIVWGEVAPPGWKWGVDD